jgi:hypothetical protein
VQLRGFTKKRWSCVLCGTKQSYVRVYASGAAKDVRGVVQQLNAARGEVAASSLRFSTHDQRASASVEPEDDERRIDATDGGAYTRTEFIAFYGGAHEWDSSDPAHSDRHLPSFGDSAPLTSGPLDRDDPWSGMCPLAPAHPQDSENARCQQQQQQQEGHAQRQRWWAEPSSATRADSMGTDALYVTSLPRKAVAKRARDEGAAGRGVRRIRAPPEGADGSELGYGLHAQPGLQERRATPPAASARKTDTSEEFFTGGRREVVEEEVWEG